MGFVDVEEMRHKVVAGVKKDTSCCMKCMMVMMRWECVLVMMLGCHLSDEELAVLRESDVEEEGDDNEDGLDEEMEEDLDVEVMEGDMDMLGADDGVAGVSGTCRKVQKLLPKEESNGGGHGTILSGVGTVRLHSCSKRV